MELKATPQNLQVTFPVSCCAMANSTYHNIYRICISLERTKSQSFFHIPRTM